MDGRRLDFHLSAINNQNFVMSDAQTGTWWQQASGAAILGPLHGRRLRPVFADEVSFATWRREHSAGRVLRPAAGSAWRQFSDNWEAATERLPVTSAAFAGALGARRDTAGAMPPRTVVVGIAVGGVERAYPLAVLRRQSPVLDDLGGIGVVLLVDADGRSVRVFESAVDGRRVDFFRPAAGAAAPAAAGRWVDGVTGSAWDFQGSAVAGPWRGRRLRPLPATKDYWFDWLTYHPRTSIYTGGGRG